MRQLVGIRTDQGVSILERVPGPYSHSEPTENLLFSMSAEEAAAMEQVDQRTVKPQTETSNSGGQ